MLKILKCTIGIKEKTQKAKQKMEHKLIEYSDIQFNEDVFLFHKGKPSTYSILPENSAT